MNVPPQLNLYVHTWIGSEHGRFRVFFKVGLIFMAEGSQHPWCLWGHIGRTEVWEVAEIETHADDKISVCVCVWYYT